MIKSSILVLCASVVTSVSALTFSREIDLKWEEFKKINLKIYQPEDESTRKEIFQRTNFAIENHNSNASKYFVTEHNLFSDKSETEKQLFLGLRRNNRKLSKRKWTPGNQSSKFPATLDYRSDKCMQPVKYQGGCGCCWAFTAITPIEFSRCKSTGFPISLSEQQLLDCDPVNNACRGGWFDDAWEYLKNGSSRVVDYGPYKARKGRCTAERKFNRAMVADYEWVDPNETAMMKALQHGPLATAFNVVDSFFNYKEGIYFGDLCKTTVNHSVVIVGYGSLFGVPYWICRNSWGKSWGSGGYFLVARGVNMCNIEMYPAKVNLTKRKPKEF